jgi:alpha-tubulin suppressor-like RCC1 family protein
VLLTTLLLALGAVESTAATASPGEALAWGDNSAGQLGNGTSGYRNDSSVPVTVVGISGVTAVAGGGLHSMALLSNGTVMGWGGNAFGQLGDGTRTRSAVPVLVRKLSEATAVAAGAWHSLALLGNQTVMAWGENEFGQLGYGVMGSGTGRREPVPVTGLSGVKSISAAGQDSLALLSNGTVMGWGNNESGQLGTGTSASSSAVPVRIQGLSGAVAISSGRGYNLALLSNGTVMSWGRNGRGQLGNGTTIDSAAPVAVRGLSGVTAVSAGASHSLALLGNGTIMTWGGNTFGQLGNGTTTGPETCGQAPCSKKPVPVSKLAGVTAVSAGYQFSLARRSTGTVTSWGRNNFGQLGNGTTTSTSVPGLIAGLREVAGIAATDTHSLAYR